jgi:hypothetical protein
MVKLFSFFLFFYVALNYLALLNKISGICIFLEIQTKFMTWTNRIHEIESMLPEKY